jgi:cellulose synthase/poly-beta-1,6-N-acetylglucosamine synthase-like glycosyltransferase
MRQLVQLSRGELLAFTDANTLLAPDAVLQAAMPFRDPSIGGVSAQLSYSNAADTAVTQINGAYWRLEELTKRLESETGSMMGADGAFFVIRRELYTPTPPDIIDDMHTSLNVVFQGKRLISWPKVRAFEKTAADRSDEFRRKIRIACRAFNCYRLLARKLHNQPAMTIYKFYSHKVLRWLTLPLALGGMAFLVAGLLRDGLSAIGLAILASVGVVMLLGWFGIRYFKMGFELMVSLLATFLGVIESVRGRRYQIWNSAPSGR